jgi:hypothetical protein
MKIDLHKILHPMLPDLVSFGEIRFAKKGWEDGVFGVLRLDVGIG